MKSDLLRRGIAALALLCCAACVRHRIIPDEELAMIFRDAFLSNAYVTTQGVGSDSLNLYEPVFARYGYNTTDVLYTIGNFSKRKSARLSDVVDRAIEMLDAEGAWYDREVAVLDTIGNVARRTFTRTVFSDSLIRVAALKDTARLRIRVDGLRPGDYAVSFRYRVDSTDRNPGMRGGVWLEDDDGERTGAYTMMLRRYGDEQFSRSFKADSSARTLVIDWAMFRERPPHRPSVTLRDLEVVYTPETSVAEDSLYLRQLDIRIFADEFFSLPGQKDSL